MKIFAVGASLGAAVALALAACSTPADEFDPPITQCDSTKCAAGNECVLMDGDLKCRKPCSSNVDPAAGCPANYYCAATNAPSTIPPACTKVAAGPSKGLCGAISTAAGSRLNAYSCGAGIVPQGCVAADSAGNFCCNEAPAEQLAKPVCVKQFGDIKAGPKQWGTPCSPTKGREGNDDCDVDQGFVCQGNSPADADAYCTRDKCLADRDCAGGFACETINVAPNVTTEDRTFGATTTACLRRNYGAPCKADLDCPPVSGHPQHCLTDVNSVGFCSPECTTNQNCNVEAYCGDAPRTDGTSGKGCYPFAGTVVGDGSPCAPCRSDANCSVGGVDGVCVQGYYTTERFCAQKSPVPCDQAASATACPDPKPGTAGACARLNNHDDPTDAPFQDYCVGTYELGPPKNGVQGKWPGCYTPKR
jgi:hypothetical protein